jgi:hypothetical protein
MFKKILSNFTKAKTIYRDDRQLNDSLLRLLTSKRLFIFGIVSNIIGLAYYLGKYNETNIDLSMSRYLSRKVGIIGNITIPIFMRKFVYERYMGIYNVKREEILEQDLQSYKTVKDFFIRKIDVNI